MGDDARFFNALESPSLRDFCFRGSLLLEVGEAEILQHHLDQFFNVDFRLQKVDARLVTGLARTAVRSRLTADNIPLFTLSLTEAGPPRTLPFMNEVIGLEPPNGHFHDLPLLAGDNGGVADNVGDVFLDGFSDLLTVTGRIFKAPLGKPPILFLDGHDHVLESFNAW